jgi:hypothetical protein
MKDYPLRVAGLIDPDNGEAVGYYTKGHHDAAIFLSEGARTLGYVYNAADVGHVVPTYMRWEFCAYLDGDGRSLRMLVDHDAPGRGIFPVTLLDLS